MFCSKCGKLVTDDMKFCNYCGEKIEVPNEAEDFIPTSSESVVTKKSSTKKKNIFFVIIAVAVTIVGAVIINFIINPPISGPEVLYGLEWGMTYDQVKEIDSQIRQQEFNNEQGVYLSTIDYDYMHITSKYGGAAITYYFGVSNSLEKIEIQYLASEYSNDKEIKYDVIMKKLKKYYNAVCKVSPTKGTAAHGSNEILIWNTANNQISVGGDFDSTDYVTVIITPAQ
jgi:RNA polymerase subunit RPABC4/transcription elongation factor Spt4